MFPCRAIQRLGVDDPAHLAQSLELALEGPRLDQSGLLAEEAQTPFIERRLQLFEEEPAMIFSVSAAA